MLLMMTLLLSELISIPYSAALLSALLVSYWRSTSMLLEKIDVVSEPEVAIKRSSSSGH